MLIRKTPLKRTGFTKKTERPTLQQMKVSGLVQKASSFTQKPRQRLKPRAANNEGWWDVALEIWNHRPHDCEVCLRSLGDEPLPIFFSHLLPRSTYRSMKRNPRNIRLKCADCHKQWHDVGFNALSTNPEFFIWKDMCRLYIALRNESNATDGDLT